MFNRRKHALRTVCIAAQLFWRGDKPLVLACKIVDFSAGGARIRAHFPTSLPLQVFLVKDEGENIYECETIWQEPGAAGLMFVDLCARSKQQELLKEIATAEIIYPP
jgi:hypothetical protein